MLDLIIRNARVVDGSGGPSQSADVGVADGRIAAIGDLREPARRTIDADGRVLAPGFIDVHTHYDAQVFWDPTLSPSCFHGVTSVVAGNCGFSIAPLSEDAAPYLLSMLARVEGMPETSLQTGVPWDWRSFDDYLRKLDGRVGLNMGVMCGHSALRRVVMGERATSDRATPEELARMEALLAESLRAGALGFSSTISPTHNDAAGRPVPSRHASEEELISLSRVCRDFPGTLLEFLPGIAPFGDVERKLMRAMSEAADRTLNWNVANVSAGNEAQVANQLSLSDYAREGNGEVVALVLVQTPSLRLNFRSGFLLDSLTGWVDLFQAPHAERMAWLRDPQRRRALEDSAAQGRPPTPSLLRWEDYVIEDSGDPAAKGQRVGDLARRDGKRPFDALIDVVLGDDLGTVLLAPRTPDDRAVWTRRADLWRDDRVVIGASDAGAHLDMIDSFALTTNLLAAARDNGLMSVEESVHRLTQVPARLLGLKDRGLLREGWRADLVLFDPDTVGPGQVHARYDLPGEEMRLYADAIGVSHVVVNGVLVVDDGEHTGALPGQVLRSGADTETVRPSARRLEPA